MPLRIDRKVGLSFLWIGALLAAANGVSHAEPIEWFAMEGVSHLRTFATATGATYKCSFDIANAPPSPYCPWCRQQMDSCKPTRILDPLQTTHDFSATDTMGTISKTQSMVAVASQTAKLSGQNFHVQATSQTDSSGNGILWGTAYSGGDAFLRVPPGPDRTYTFTGTFSWEGDTIPNRGGFGFTWVANTIRNPNSRPYFGSNNIVPAGQPGRLVQTGTLAPGVYELTWTTGNSRPASGKVRIVIDIEFKEADCKAAQAEMQRRGPNQTGLFGPFCSTEEAAMAAEPTLRNYTNSSAPDWLSALRREFGLVIVRDLRQPAMYYLTPPVGGQNESVSGADFTRSYRDGVAKANESERNMVIVATVHTHPTTNFGAGIYFSGTDFDQAVSTRNDTVAFPDFERIFLLRPDRCIDSFSAVPGDKDVTEANVRILAAVQQAPPVKVTSQQNLPSVPVYNRYLKRVRSVRGC